MAEITATVRPTREEVVPSRKRVKLPAWLEVAKPRLIPLLLATTLGGMALSEGWPLSSPRLVCTLGGGALASAAAGVLNCLWEQDLDGRMARTSGRALPSGRLSPTSAFIGAIACTLAAAMLLVSGVNCLAAGLSLLGLCSYVLLYTALLKPRTSQNIVIGGLAGAMPPLLGWTAVTNQVDGHALLLVLIIFAWTPPHFWALAIARKEEYAKVEIPMLPVTHGSRYTAVHSLLYTLMLFVASLLPVATGLSSWIYLIGASAMGGIFVYQAVLLLRTMKNSDAMKMFRFSIVYLMAIFPIMLLDHYLLPKPVFS